MPILKLKDGSGSDAAPEDLYARLAFPEPPQDRPYTFINMVSTVDGKILLGPVGTTARGLGSTTDQLLMRRLQANAAGAIIGAGTLRPGNVVYRAEMWRAVVTGSGDLPLDNRFFADAPDRAIVFAPATLPEDARRRLDGHARLHVVGERGVDVRSAVRIMRQEYGVRTLALEGGAALNFEFLEAGLADELFLTVTPKLKGGTSAPTIVTGRGLPDWEYLGLELVSLYHDDDELYFRYRIADRKRVEGH